MFGNNQFIQFYVPSGHQASKLLPLNNVFQVLSSAKAEVIVWFHILCPWCALSILYFIYVNMTCMSYFIDQSSFAQSISNGWGGALRPVKPNKRR